MTIVQTLQDQLADNVTTTTGSLTGVTAGNTLLVVASCFQAAATLRVVSDVDGEFFFDTRVVSASSSVRWFRLHRASAGSHTITLDNVIGGLYVIWAAYEVQGDAYSFDLSTGTGSSTNPSSGTVVVGSGDIDTLLLGGVAYAVSTSVTVESTSPTWTEDAEETNFALHTVGEIDSKIVTAAASYGANWTLGGSSTWAAGIVAYRVATAGGGGGGLSWAPLSIVASAGTTLIRTIASGGTSGQG